MNIAELTFSEDEGLVIALAVTTLAALLAGMEADNARKERKQRVVLLKLETLEKAGLQLACPHDPDALVSELSRRAQTWHEPKRNALLIDLAFADPFSPYELKVSQKDQKAALERVCDAIGLPQERVRQVFESIAEARAVHRRIGWEKVAAATVIGAIVLATGGYAAAPLIAAKLGAAAGLSGAAAVSHGLALLGGGSLAVGGSGVAGGMALIAGCGGAVGGLGMGGATALWNAGYAAALGELVKLQVTYKEILLRSQLREMRAADVVDSLLQQREELEKRLAEEKSLNDDKAARIKELERIKKGYEDTIRWLKAQQQGAA